MKTDEKLFNENKIEKYSLGEQLENLQERTGLSLNKINSILFKYKEYAVDTVINGKDFRFGYIAVISTNQGIGDQLDTLAYTARCIGEDLGIPYFSVLGVLDNYVKLAEVNLRMGKSFNIVGILKLKPVLGEDKKVKNISASLSRSMNSFDLGIDFKIRASVLSNIRDLVSG